MTATTPTRVIMYTLAAEESDDGIPIAEFRYHPDIGVSFTELHPTRGEAGRRIREDGIRSLLRRRFVRPSEGAEFMRALLEPINSTYYYFLDKSHETDG